MRRVSKQLNIEKILGVDFYMVKNKTIKNKFKMIIKEFLYSLISKYKPLTIKQQREKVEFLFIKTQSREDYDTLYKGIFSQCNHKKIDLKIDTYCSFNILFMINLFSNIKLFYLFIKKYKLLNALYLYIKIIRYFEILKVIKPIKYKNLIVFSEVQPLENLIVQYSNKLGVNTVTLQHGLYIDYKNFPNVNMLNYVDVSSNYLLAWGKSTEDLFKRYNSKINVEICGKPLVSNNVCCGSQTRLLGVVFDQPMFREYNEKLLRIAYEIAVKRNMEIVVRLHPQDSKDYYDLDSDIVTSERKVEESEFILAHTTSMIFEYLALGFKVFKLKSDIPSNDLSDKLKFGSSLELEEKMSEVVDFYSEAKRHIEYKGKDSNSRYREFFDKLSL